MNRRALLFMLSLATGCASTRPAEKGPPAPPVFEHARTLAPRAELSPASKQALSARMRHHRDQMGALTLAVWLLDYDRIAVLADALASETMLAKPQQLPDDPLIPQLPGSFFSYQRELQQNAAELAGAARSRNDARIGESFSGVSQSCIGCHAAYLHEPAPKRTPPPADQAVPFASE